MVDLFPPGNLIFYRMFRTSWKTVSYADKAAWGRRQQPLSLRDEDRLVEARVQAEGEEARVQEVETWARPRGLLTLWRMVSRPGILIYSE